MLTHAWYHVPQTGTVSTVIIVLLTYFALYCSLRCSSVLLVFDNTRNLHISISSTARAEASRVLHTLQPRRGRAYARIGSRGAQESPAHAEQTCGAMHSHFMSTILAKKGFAGSAELDMMGHDAGPHGFVTYVSGSFMSQQLTMLHA